MSAKLKIGLVSEVPDGTNKVYTVGEREVAVFNVDGELYAVDNCCPHRGASLSDGTLVDGSVTCPWHKWRFDLKTGKCLTQPGNWLRKFDVSIEGDNVILDTPQSDDQPNTWDGIYRYLVRYGTMGWIGRFGSIQRIDCSYKDHVVVQTTRGLEVGEVLAVPTENGQDNGNNQQPAGELLRRLATDEQAKHRRRIQEQPLDWIAQTQELIASHHLAVEVIDCELLFDGKTVVFYYLGGLEPDLDQLGEDLTGRHQVKVIFHPVIEPPVATESDGGCGRPGCGGGGCGAESSV